MKTIITKAVKIVLSIFPATLPPAIYNSLIKISLFKYLINGTIKIITPSSSDIGEGILLFNKSDPVMTAWITMGSFEPATVKLFRDTVKEGMNVVDIGANIGYYTVIASKRVGNNGKIFAYEPNMGNFHFLQKNIECNNMKNVTPIMKAMSDSTGERNLFLGDTKCTTHAFSDNSDTGKTELVKTDTLDNSLKAYGSPIIDIIKMDIEGAEVLALDGMKETISKNPNLIMFTEFYPKAIKRLGKSPIKYLRTLKSLGFKLSTIDEDTNTLTPLNDFDKFVANFKDDESVTNIYATKK